MKQILAGDKTQKTNAEATVYYKIVNSASKVVADPNW
jgi:hypothetical protein